MSRSELTVRHLAVAESWLVHSGSLLFYGKQTTTDRAAVDALIAEVEDRRVLRCHAEHTDARRSLSALIGLFCSVDETELAVLAPSSRRTLEESIFRPPLSARRAPSVNVLAPAVLNLLRALSGSTPLLLVVEAVHQLDRESRAVLSFVADQTAGLPIQLVAIEETDDRRVPQGHPICPPPLMMIRLPLSGEPSAS